MDPSSIVPPKPRIVERRQNMWRALQMCGGAAVLALGTVLVLPAHLYAVPVRVLTAVAVVSGVFALVLRFVEQPRQIVVRAGDYKIDYDWDPPIVH